MQKCGWRTMCKVVESWHEHCEIMKSTPGGCSHITVTHENKAHQTVNHIQCLLYETKLHDTDDLLKHLDILKSYCDCINRFPNTKFYTALFSNSTLSCTLSTLLCFFQLYCALYPGGITHCSMAPTLCHDHSLHPIPS